MDGLPEQARVRRGRGEGVWWGFTEELLAQAVEVLSVLAADHRFKEPRTVQRPYAPPAPAAAAAPSGFQLMLAAAKGRRVRHG